MKVKICVLTLMAMMLTGCKPESKNSSIPKDLIGKVCTVQLDRNALGTACNVPVPPTTGSINGSEVCVGGTIEKIDSNWVVVSQEVRSGADKKTIYIPMESVLLITHQK